jgi:PAS domain S-box-containing protein
MDPMPVMPPAACLPDEIDELPVVYVELDAQGRIARANRAAAAVFQRGREQLIGTLIWDLMPADAREHSCSLFFSAMESGEEPVVGQRYLFSGASGFRTYLSFRKLIRDAAGKPVGMRVVYSDVTEQDRICREAHRAQVWLETVLESVPAALMVTDALGFIRHMNREAEALLGRRAAAMRGRLVEEMLAPMRFATGCGMEISHARALLEPIRNAKLVLDREDGSVCVSLTTAPVFEKASGAITGVVSIWSKVEEGR